MQQSEELAAFYKAIWEWIQSGYVGYAQLFYKEHGLCGNLYRYTKHHYADIDCKFLTEMQAQWHDVDYPFNNNNLLNYELEKNKYLNPQRLAWIKAHLPG